ncbi:MAG: hypothetical protein AB7E47_17890 [Desulfovibrionaceae bacterium]
MTEEHSLPDNVVALAHAGSVLARDIAAALARPAIPHQDAAATLDDLLPEVCERMAEAVREIVELINEMDGYPADEAEECIAALAEPVRDLQGLSQKLHAIGLPLADEPGRALMAAMVERPLKELLLFLVSLQYSVLAPDTFFDECEGGDVELGVDFEIAEEVDRLDQWLVGRVAQGAPVVLAGALLQEGLGAFLLGEEDDAVQ